MQLSKIQPQFLGHLGAVGSNPFRGDNTTEDLQANKKLIIDTT